MKMATYKQIQAWVKQQYGFTPETCWIAHVKEISGLPVKEAPNRIRSKRVKPCPPDKIQHIQAAFQYFGMLN